LELATIEKRSGSLAAALAALAAARQGKAKTLTIVKTVTQAAAAGMLFSNTNCQRSQEYGSQIGTRGNEAGQCWAMRILLFAV
jgi:hypothetical protein